MFTELTAAPYNGQRKPPEWDDLIAVTSEAFVDDLDYLQQYDAAHAAWNTIAELSVEQHEASFYYGVGLVGCSYAKPLSDPDTRADFTAAAASQLALAARNTRGLFRKDESRISQGLRVSDIVDPPVGSLGSIEHARQEYKALPPVVRLVANTLRHARPSDFNTKPDKRNLLIDRVLQDRTLLQEVNANAWTGACSVIRSALMVHHARETSQKVTRELESLFVEDIADEATIAGFDLTHVAFQTAGLRVDEFRNLRNLMRISPDGVFYIDTKDIPRHPGEPVQPVDGRVRRVLHKKRLRCPLLYVAGVVPMVGAAIPFVVNAAQRQLIAGEPPLPVSEYETVARATTSDRPSETEATPRAKRWSSPSRAIRPPRRR